MDFLRRRRALLLALAGGITFALTSPPTDLYPAVVIGLALLAASLEVPPAPTVRRPALRAFGLGAAWGTAAGIVGLRFVPPVIVRFTPLGLALGVVALVLLAAAQSLIWAVGSAVADLLHRRARLPFPLAFGAGVLAALCVPTIFAWSPAGLVSPWPSFVQLADVIGERGVSLLFAVGAALLARAVRQALRTNVRDRAALRPALIAFTLFLALHLYGRARIASIQRASAGLPTVRVGLVDQAVKPLDRWNRENHPAILRTLRELTASLEAEGAELTIWPEAAYPYALPHDARVMPRGPRSVFGRDVRGPIVVGLITEDPPTPGPTGELERNSYNSATLVAPDGSMQPTYDKLELLWFGETVPGGNLFPWLRRTFQRSGGLVPGDAPRALTMPARAGVPPMRMAVLNCYEDTLPALGRRLASALAPTLLVNVTNDAWFYATAEPELHARLGAMRAIELRRDLVRAVNLGTTSWIDAAGIVRAKYDEQRPGTLMTTPALRDDPPTIYARLGDAPLFAAIAAAALFAYVKAKRRNARASEPAPPASA
jgi:apolipoprotein N-acyltransferase